MQFHAELIIGHWGLGLGLGLGFYLLMTHSQPKMGQMRDHQAVYILLDLCWLETTEDETQWNMWKGISGGETCCVFLHQAQVEKRTPQKKKKTLADMKKNKNLLSLRTCGSVGAISALYSCTGVTSALLE